MHLNAGPKYSVVSNAKQSPQHNGHKVNFEFDLVSMLGGRDFPLRFIFAPFWRMLRVEALDYRWPAVGVQMIIRGSAAGVKYFATTAFLNKIT